MGNAETRDASHGAAAGKPHGGAAGGNYGADRQIKMELDIQKDRMGKLNGTSECEEEVKEKEEEDKEGEEQEEVRKLETARH